MAATAFVGARRRWQQRGGEGEGEQEFVFHVLFGYLALKYVCLVADVSIYFRSVWVPTAFTQRKPTWLLALRPSPLPRVPTMYRVHSCWREVHRPPQCPLFFPVHSLLPNS